MTYTHKKSQNHLMYYDTFSFVEWIEILKGLKNLWSEARYITGNCSCKRLLSAEIQSR